MSFEASRSPEAARSTILSNSGVDAAGEHQRRRWQPGVARRPVVVAREALGIAHAPDAGGDVRSQPRIGGAHIGGVDGQAVHEQFAGLRTLAGKFGNGRPRRFGVHVIGRDRRDAAPVVEARVDQLLIDVRRKVWRRLDIHVGPENETRGRDGPQQIVEIRFLGIGELCVGLGPEVLDDDFLDMTMGSVQIGNCLQRVDPLVACLADADQDSGRERNL